MTDAETSFPVTNKPLTADQWNSVTSGIGNGTLDMGIGDYNMVFDNSTDTVTIRPPEAYPRYYHLVVGGFYHRLHDPVTLSIPPVKVSTRYNIVACMDPGRADTKPVELKVAPSPLDRSGGKQYVILATVDREPNKVLTDSVIRRTKPRITPHAEVEQWDALPDPEDFLIGTKIHVASTSSTYRNAQVKGARQWVRTSGTSTMATGWMPGWQFRGSIPDGLIITPMSNGWRCEFHGQYLRHEFPFTIRDSHVTIGYFIPERWRTSYWMDMHVPGTYYDSVVGVVPIYFRVDFQSGELAAICPKGQSLYIRRDGVLNFSVTWVAKRDSIDF